MSTTQTTTTTTSRRFGATATGARSWSTDHKGAHGAPYSYLMANIVAAAEAGEAYAYPIEIEVAAMGADLAGRAGKSLAWGKAEARKLMGLAGSKGRTKPGHRADNRVTARLTNCAPERSRAARAHRDGIIDDDAWAAVREAYRGCFETYSTTDHVYIVMTEKGRRTYGVRAARSGDLIGYTRANRYAGAREIRKA